MEICILILIYDLCGILTEDISFYLQGNDVFYIYYRSPPPLSRF